MIDFEITEASTKPASEAYSIPGEVGTNAFNFTEKSAVDIDKSASLAVGEVKEWNIANVTTSGSGEFSFNTPQTETSFYRPPFDERENPAVIIGDRSTVQSRLPWTDPVVEPSATDSAVTRQQTDVLDMEDLERVIGSLSMNPYDSANGPYDKSDSYGNYNYAQHSAQHGQYNEYPAHYPGEQDAYAEYKRGPMGHGHIQSVPQVPFAVAAAQGHGQYQHPSDRGGFRGYGPSVPPEYGGINNGYGAPQMPPPRGYNSGGMPMGQGMHAGFGPAMGMRPGMMQGMRGPKNSPPGGAPASNVVSHFDGHVYKVQFKRTHRNFLRSAAVEQPIEPGDFVIVEADRGEDLGVVCEVQPMPIFFREGGSLFNKDKVSPQGLEDRQSGVKHILRHAQPHEFSLLPVKTAEEESIVEVCRERAIGVYLLPMVVSDAEYQFDRHKLTIYYESQMRIDFRELVRDMFAVYKTRIWMEHVSYSFRPHEGAARALASGQRQLFFGPGGGGASGGQYPRQGGGGGSASHPAGPGPVPQPARISPPLAPGQRGQEDQYGPQGPPGRGGGSVPGYGYGPRGGPNPGAMPGSAGPSPVPGAVPGPNPGPAPVVRGGGRGLRAGAEAFYGQAPPPSTRPPERDGRFDPAAGTPLDDYRDAYGEHGYKGGSNHTPSAQSLLQQHPGRSPSNQDATNRRSPPDYSQQYGAHPDPHLAPRETSPQYPPPPYGGDAYAGGGSGATNGQRKSPPQQYPPQQYGGQDGYGGGPRQPPMQQYPPPQYGPQYRQSPSYPDPGAGGSRQSPMVFPPHYGSQGPPPPSAAGGHDSYGSNPRHSPMQYPPQQYGGQDGYGPGQRQSPMQQYPPPHYGSHHPQQSPPYADAGAGGTRQSPMVYPPHYGPHGPPPVAAGHDGYGEAPPSRQSPMSYSQQYMPPQAQPHQPQQPQQMPPPPQDGSPTGGKQPVAYPPNHAAAANSMPRNSPTLHPPPTSEGVQGASQGGSQGGASSLEQEPLAIPAL